jgi:type I restriction enzyme S subunit
MTEMKHSGIDWIGEIPAHWDVKRFKAFAKAIKGKSLDVLSEPDEGSLKVLSVECLRQDEAQFYDYVFESDNNQICTPNDIVVIWDGAGVGEFLRAKNGALSSTIAKVKFTSKKVLPKYFWYWRYKIEYRLKSIPTGMGIPHLNPNLLNNYKIAIPPLVEQQAIADYLDKKTAEIDSNISAISSKIDALKRLKQSLIDEVVTGKRRIEKA